MKINILLLTKLVLLLFMQLSAGTVFSQTRTISGTVSESDGTTLPGATVQVKGTNLFAVSDRNGSFSLANVPNNTVTLVASFVGFAPTEITVAANLTSISIVLSDSRALDEVVVTGVFDERTRMDASIAITTLGREIIDNQVPNSAPDLLRNVPGVYVNSSVGEIRNSVSSRGITVGSTDGSFGYEYVSMQEDGLPITNTTYFSYGPDFFLRADATLERLDAVRGGPASVAAANAPGGIFNYVSKRGGNIFGGEVRLKQGLLGNGANSLTRLDGNIGGPLGKNWFYNIGGFYRYDQGARYPGYPMNEGGQVKANVEKKYSKGSLKIFLKYLDDKNGFAQPILTTGYDNPRLAPGFNSSSTNFPEAFKYSAKDLVNGGNYDFDSRNQVKNKYKSIAFTWDHELGNDWSFTNSAKYAANSVLYNTQGGVIPSSITDLTPYFFLGGFGAGFPGAFTFSNVKTGETLANVSVTGGVPVVTSSTLPGQDILPNSILLIPLSYYDNTVNEFLERFAFNKKIGNMNFNLGGYFGYSDAKRYSGGDIGLATMENHPKMLSLSFAGTPLYGISNGVPITGAPGVYQLTNAAGVGQGTGNLGAYISFNATQNQGALFFGHTWNLSDKWTFDWGVRYESVNIKGNNIRPNLIGSPFSGGTDGDIFTTYDNNSLDTLGSYKFDYTINTFSYSAALNYKLNDNLAIYGRYSQGKKAPDLDFYFTLNTPQNLLLYRPKVRSTEQIELGLKSGFGKSDLFVTPFYSVLSGVPVGQIFQDTNGTYYFPPRTYAKYQTVGVEIETNIYVNPHFSVRGVATFQKTKLGEYEVWEANANGPEDDTILSYSGNEADNAPRVMLNVTPTYTISRFYTFLTWSYLGSRQANAANVFKLPAFSQFDFSAGYNFSKALQLSLNVNNLFNTYGVMTFQRPGSLGQVLGGNASFSKAEYDAAVAADTPYSTVGIQPRAFYLTATFKF
ncbi:outer membrane receptor protein involved in Fe transport [Algoriphagus sp. 4150]|uniref:TonB-dependent receptor n=1 Tax=Algoriphagus sp. 4150 TaxID=2817756 RepID=UPI0028615D96|nr:TonB-dependent receptor [Algoriphagus sp. 4150]MDR7128330.1 outer membrane receptor protein involved in Fe transport [Algoriphagus sp. 4150]